MGFSLLDWLLFLSIFCLSPLPLASQVLPNTDGYFVYEFLMGLGQGSVQDFNFSEPFCSWQGVFCDSGQENIVEFVAADSGLSGSIPETTIGKLSKLQHLDLSNNKITGLSSDFWSLGSLKSLNLSNNRISGSLPGNIVNFGSIEVIDLSINDFNGEIPDSVSSLVSLQVLKLNRNGFGSSIPPGLMNCHSLVTVDLSSNRFNGSLPDGFAAAFPKLETLNLADNELHGRDSDFSQLKSLTALNVSGNMLHGSVVGFFRDKIEVVDLSRNRFTGHIFEVQSGSGSAYNLSGLVFLDLSENDLSGEILGSVSQAKNLRFLSLAGNRFGRQGFPRIGMISGLEHLNLSKSGLIGHIPSEISQLKKLKSLDLSKNYISGRIPVLRSKNLQILDLSWNNLTGEVPISVLDKLPWMESFNFSYNNLTLCANNPLLDPQILRTAFYGSTNTCPIAADPELFKRRGSSRKCSGLKLTLALSLTLTLALMTVFILLAFGFKRRNNLWTVNRPGSSKDERQISGPFSFQTDSSTWVADLKKPAIVPVVMFEKPLLDITFGDLLSATSNFDSGTVLAEGRFGPVYGGYLTDGTHVALKVLVHDSTLTDHEAAREFEYLGRIKHPNLVPLTGYCLAGDQRIAIYDYMENGNLQNLLHDSSLGIQTTDENNGSPTVEFLTTWRFRHRVALGTARAVAFLHHGCFPSIVHRDVKSSSVYLDSNMEPRLSDFGLAKLFGTGIDEEIIRGPPGYLPPEFSLPENNTPTVKSDVYCFGVVLFELITGKNPIGDNYYGSEDKEGNLVSWVRGLVRKNRASIAIDPRIRDTRPDFQIEEALKIGFLCTADHPSKRPSMHQVVGLLKDIEPVAV